MCLVLYKTKTVLATSAFFPKRIAGNAVVAVWACVGSCVSAEHYNAVLVQALAFVAQASFILFYRLVYASRFAVSCQRPLHTSMVCFYPRSGGVCGAPRRPPLTASTISLNIQSCYIEIEQKFDNIILLIYEC